MDFDVRMHQVDSVNALHDYIKRHLRFRLRRHEEHIRTLKFRLTEQDRVTGSGAKLCFLAAELVPSGKVIITETNSDLYRAVSRAIERLKATLRRKIGRQHDSRRHRESLRNPIC